MALVLLPDVERVVSTLLRDVDELAELGDRVYTVTPRDVGDEPFVLVRRIGGVPPVSRPFVLDLAGLQVDVYGGTKRQAHTFARVVQAALAELAGPVDDGIAAGFVTGTTLGALRFIPDEAWSPARTRYVLDADVFVKRGRLSGGDGSTRPVVTGRAA